MRRGEQTAGYKISYKIQLIKSCKTHTHTHGERHMVGCVLQLRKLPWKWAWQDFFWHACAERRLGTSCRCLSLAQPKSAIESATMRTTRHSSGEGKQHQPPTKSPQHHSLSRPPIQLFILLLPIPHPEGYANSNYLPLRVDWVTYLNWFSRWAVGGDRRGRVSQSLPSAPPPSPLLLGFWVCD